MSLIDLIKKIHNINVLCIGDIMMDHYYYGEVKRISPEAPVPIFLNKSETKMLGGVGNVVNNLYKIGCSVDIVSFVGDDIHGKEIKSMLQKICKNVYLYTFKEYPTIEKTRIIANNNHIIRIDREKKFETDILFNNKINEKIKKYDIILLSDYGKGVLSESRCQSIINKAIESKRIIIVDPKGDNYKKYFGATVIKPNLKEFCQAAKIICHPTEPDFKIKIFEGAKKILSLYRIKSLLITLSEYGMAYISSQMNSKDNIILLPTIAQEIFDVSGAGDTALAYFGASFAAGGTIYDSIKLANIASGIAVGKVGTAIVSSDEIINKLLGMDIEQRVKNKIVDIEKLKHVSLELHKKNKKIGLTNGCFDLIHKGHLYSLMQAKHNCDILIVGVNSDNSVKKIKGPQRPIQNEITRAEILASLEYVDYVIIFDSDNALPLVNIIKPDIILKQGYTIDKWPEANEVKKQGGTYKILSKIDGYSTSSIIKKIKKLN